MAISKTSSTASRRRFLKGASAAAAAPLILPSRLFGAGSANERIGIGLIGCGKIMNGHHKSHQDAEDVQIRAVSDVKDWQREEYVNKVNQGYAKITGKSDYDDCKGYANFEDLLARDDIDAVVVGTPDHWHAAATIAAMKAGKDVYCEKPLTLTIEEGIAIRKVAKETGRVVQTGSQQRSDQYFRRACELVVNGYIGELTEVHVGIGNFKPIPELGEQEIPEGFDYDRWLGQAPMEPYHIDRVKGDYGGGWRNFWEYGNRKNGDFGAHHFDIVQWALQMDDSGPVNYVPAGHNGEPFSYFQYANDLKVFKNSDKKRLSINFYGKDGSVHVGRGGKLETTPENIRATRFKESDTMLEESRSHRANWLDCIRSRKQPICHPEVGHRTATICHLLTVAERSGKPVQWDPAKEELIDATDEQKELTYRKRREGFELPV